MRRSSSSSSLSSTPSSYEILYHKVGQVRRRIPNSEVLNIVHVVISVDHDGDMKNMLKRIFPFSLFFSSSSSSSKTAEQVPNVIIPMAFTYCRKMTRVDFPFDGPANKLIQGIGDDAFYYCRKLPYVAIPYSVQIIGENAFQKCDSLKTVEFLSSSSTSTPQLHTIGQRAFKDCTVLQSITLPYSIQNIGQQLFEKCYFLTQIDLSSLINIVNKCIPPRCFADCVRLEIVKLPKSGGIFYIEEEAFFKCKNLRTINLPSTLIEIRSKAFAYCQDGLTNLQLPSSLQIVGKSAFESCFSLNVIEFVVSSTSSSASTSTSTSIMAHIDEKSDVDGHVMATTKNNSQLKEIGPYAFRDCKSLRHVRLSNNNKLTLVNRGAFYGCHGLLHVDLPSSLQRLRHEVFDECHELKDVQFFHPNESSGAATTSTGTDHLLMEEIEHYTFRGCSKLQTIRLPESIRSIGNGTFKKCTTITSISFAGGINDNNTTSIIISDCIRKIGSEAFYCCTGLKSVELPNTMHGIQEGLFRGCDSLTTIIFPTASSSSSSFFLSIGAHAFRGCKSLRSITNIPDSVRVIGPYAFYGCTRLSSINIPDSILQIGRHAFTICSPSFTIQMPRTVHTETLSLTNAMKELIEEGKVDGYECERHCIMGYNNGNDGNNNCNGTEGMVVASPVLATWLLDTNRGGRYRFLRRGRRHIKTNDDGDENNNNRTNSNKNSKRKKSNKNRRKNKKNKQEKTYPPSLWPWILHRVVKNMNISSSATNKNEKKNSSSSSSFLNATDWLICADPKWFIDHEDRFSDRIWICPNPKWYIDHEGRIPSIIFYLLTNGVIMDLST